MRRIPNPNPNPNPIPNPKPEPEPKPKPKPNPNPNPSPSPNPDPKQHSTRGAAAEPVSPLYLLSISSLSPYRILRAVPLLSHLTEAERDGVISQVSPYIFVYLPISPYISL